MAVRRQICRYESKATEVKGKLFFQADTHSSKAAMRQAAKRFVETPEFTENCLYYDGFFVNGRWRFEPVGLGQSF